MKYSFKPDKGSNWFDAERNILAKMCGGGPGGVSHFDLLSENWRIRITFQDQWTPADEGIKLTGLIVSDEFPFDLDHAKLIVCEFLNSWRHSPLRMKGRKRPKPIIM